MLIGVGPGNSALFMWKYEKFFHILAWGERVTASSSPQNSYVQILADYGIVGMISFVGVIIAYLRKE